MSKPAPQAVQTRLIDPGLITQVRNDALDEATKSWLGSMDAIQVLSAMVVCQRQPTGPQPEIFIQAHQMGCQQA